MNTIEKIRAEIERLIELNKTKNGFPASWPCEVRIEAYEHFLSFLDTLEEKSEIPTIPVDLEKEIENAGKDVIRQAHYHNKIFDIPQTHFEDVQLMDIFKAGVYKGYELGRNAK